MFFLYSAVAGLNPKRILESGRARAQSTLVLALCFPDAHIISIEREEDTPDARFAEERLRGFGNVELRYGDSMEVLPQLLEQDDVVLIDGPKSFKALLLGIELLETRKPLAVFAHDFSVRELHRKFARRWIPLAFFSDHPDWVRRYSFLDLGPGATPTNTLPATYATDGFGATFVCLPRGFRFSYTFPRMLLGNAILQAYFRRQQRHAKARNRGTSTAAE